MSEAARLEGLRDVIASVIEDEVQGQADTSDAHVRSANRVMEVLEQAHLLETLHWGKTFDRLMDIPEAAFVTLPNDEGRVTDQ